MFHAITQTNFFKCFFSQFSSFFCGNVTVQQWQLNIINHFQIIDKMIALKNKSKLFISEMSKLFIVQVFCSFLSNFYFTFCWYIKQTNNVEQRTFSATRRAHNGEKL